MRPPIIRAAEKVDFPAIASMRAQLFARLGRRVETRFDVGWLVAERDGRVLAAASVRTMAPRKRFIVDFVRDERRLMSLPALAALGTFLCEWCARDGYALEAVVPRLTGRYDELLRSTGGWRVLEQGPEAVRYIREGSDSC